MAERVILYVEDNPDDVHIMKMSFERLKVNYTLHVAFGGREALERLKNTGIFTDRHQYPVPEIIFLDLTMPEVDGFEILQMIKAEADFRSIPVFAITGSLNPGFMQRALELGATGFIKKGWRPATFAETLGYINIQLMAAMKYNLLFQHQDHDEGNPEPQA